MGRQRKDDNPKVQIKNIMTIEESDKAYHEFCKTLGHKPTEKTYPPREDWIVKGETFIYIYDPNAEEYMNYINGLGIFEFNNNFQKYCLIKERTDISNYVRNLKSIAYLYKTGKIDINQAKSMMSKRKREEVYI